MIKAGIKDGHSGNVLVLESRFSVLLAIAQTHHIRPIGSTTVLDRHYGFVSFRVELTWLFINLILKGSSPDQVYYRYVYSDRIGVVANWQ